MLDKRELSALVVNFNTRHLLDEMFAALEADPAFVGAQVVLVDNASSDGSADYLRAHYAQHQLVFSESNLGFGRANNLALEAIEGEFVLLLNTDAFVAPDTLTQTLVYMRAHPACGVLGVKLLSRDGSLQPSCRYFPTPWNVFLNRTGLDRWLPWVQRVDDMAWTHDAVRECDWVPGCYYLIRRTVIEQVGLFDPRYFLYYEEVDHCRAVKAAGWQVVCYPHSSVVHIGGESAKSVGELTASGSQLSALQVESELLYFRKHHGLAGFVLHLVLSVAGDALLALKAVLRGAGVRRVAEVFANTRLVWALARKTGWASRPTR